MRVSTVTLDNILPSGPPRFAELINQGLKSGSLALDRLANFKKASQFKWTKERPFVERLAALYYWVQLFTGIWGYMLAFYLGWKFTWRFLAFFIPYLAYIFGPGSRPSRDGSWPTPFKRLVVWRVLQRYFQARWEAYVRMARGAWGRGEGASAWPLFGFHPHGVMPVSVRPMPRSGTPTSDLQYAFFPGAQRLLVPGAHQPCYFVSVISRWCVDLVGSMPLILPCRTTSLALLLLQAWFTFGTTATGFDRLFPGVDVRITTLPMNFRGPLLREYLLLHGVCDVSRNSVLSLLRRGKSIAIAIGGGAESLHTAPGTHDLVLNRRKGFVKVALQTGASLVPVYLFGETDTYSTLNRLPFNSRVRRFQRAMEKLLGWTWPIAWGTGLFLPWGVLPYPARLNTVVGAPIHQAAKPHLRMTASGLGGCCAAPCCAAGDVQSAEFRALVDRYHGQYVASVRELFRQHKELYAKGEDDLRIVE